MKSFIILIIAALILIKFIGLPISGAMSLIIVVIIPIMLILKLFKKQWGNKHHRWY